MDGCCNLYKLTFRDGAHFQVVSCSLADALRTIDRVAASLLTLDTEIITGYVIHKETKENIQKLFSQL